MRNFNQKFRLRDSDHHPSMKAGATTHSLERNQTQETLSEYGQLIAKVCGQGLELKCKRCKRIVVIPFSSIEGWGTVQT